MNKRFSTLGSLMGIDGAIAFTVLSRIIQAGGGVITILFIARYLNIVEQGFYFTFGSILAIQVFFELGLTNIITQFVAHEVVHLGWVNNTRLQGPVEAQSRLSSLLRFCIRWFSCISMLLIVILLIGGYLFFYKYSQKSYSINWKFPWFILSFSTAFSLIVAPILAYLEGLGKVKEVAKMRLVQQTFQLSLLLVFLTLGFKLYSSPIASLLGFTVLPMWIYFSYKKDLLLNIWKQKGEWEVNYRLEIFPYQWRIALSWISGYFIFQLFNPVLFATEGPVVAGQMGLTLAALSGVLSISMSWINTKIPFFSNMVAKRDYLQLDKVFKQTLRQASFITALGLVALILVVSLLKHYQLNVADRFLPITPLILLCIATFFNQLVFAMAAYLRSHKQEPFLILSIVMGILTAISTLLLGNIWGLYGIVVGYSSLIIFVNFTWALVVFKQKRKLWHS